MSVILRISRKRSKNLVLRSQFFNGLNIFTKKLLTLPSSIPNFNFNKNNSFLNKYVIPKKCLLDRKPSIFGHSC